MVNGLQKNRRCARAVLPALNLSKVVDTVNKSERLTDIEESSLPAELQTDDHKSTERHSYSHFNGTHHEEKELLPFGYS